MGTKEKILETALELFSKRGFSAVSVRDIATVVGVRESAMYRHFTSKQAVFDRLVADYIKMSDRFMASIHALPSENPAAVMESVALYGRLADEDFLRMGLSVFTDFLMLPEVLKFWRMLSIERFHDDGLARMWNRHLFEEPIKYQTMFFGLLIHAGAIKNIDPRMLALHFFAPLQLLYLQALPFEPDGPEFMEALNLAKLHMQHFRDTYAKKGGHAS